jgi:two-component system, OmpR family, heavy metal sensor histidine kinase CusS
VANTGPGIPPADRDRIFERFYRADPSRSGRVDGVGLGLSLSREIIRAHGGELSLEGCTDGLTRFAMELRSRFEAAEIGP